MIEILIKFVKFCAVGASGLLVDFSITYLLKEKAKQNKYLSNSLGFVCAASSNFVLNRLYTFNSHNEQVSAEYFSFLLVSVVGLLINNGVIWWLHERRQFHFYLSKVGAIGVATFWNFFANVYFTFSENQLW